MFINQNKYLDHSFFMKLALAQANKNLGNTSENPSVGCVITKNNSMIGAGCTGRSGRPHAEINAIKNSKNEIEGSNLYVTLEPCSHYGKTPPCTKSIIKRKIKKVFFSINDPDVRSYNKSFKLFSLHKVKINKGVLKKQIYSFYRSYIKSKSNLLPFVTCKLAVSKDNFTVNKKSKWITNMFSRARVHLMRSNHDCILTTSETIIADNPRLTCRINGLLETSPSRIILDTNLKVPLNSKIIHDAKTYQTIIFYNNFNKKKISKLKKLNIKTYKINVDQENKFNLNEVLLKAKKLGFFRIFVESGMKLITNFLNQNLVDDLIMFISKNKLGNNGKKNTKNNLKYFTKNKKKTLEKVNLFGDQLIKYEIK